MNFNVTVKVELSGEVLTAIAASMKLVLERLNDMANELDDLKAAVAANTTVIGSAIELLQGLKAKLDAAIASGDPAALTALSAELGAQDQALASAIAANTPTAP